MSSLVFFHRFVNLLLVLCLISPLTLSFWRGTWYILDLLVFPHDPFLSGWTTFLSSFGAIYLISLVENYVKAFLNGTRRKNQWYLMLFYPLALLTVASWRGLWMLIDYYSSPSFISGLVTHAVGFIIVFMAKATSSIIPVPGYCASETSVDPSESILQLKIAFTRNAGNFCTRMLNTFITVFVVGSGVICYWRGTWIIQSMALKPGVSLKSSAFTIILGSTVCSVYYCLGEFLATKKPNPPYDPGWRIIEAAFVYILGLGTVGVWIGIWSFLDICILPDRPVASAFVCHSFGIFFLYLVQGAINLVGSPVGCRSHDDNTLEGLNMGSYLKRQTVTEEEPDCNKEPEDVNST